MSNELVWQALCKWPLLTGGAGIKTEMKVTNLIQLSLFLKSIFLNLPQG